MDDNKKYLDYEGFKSFYNELAGRLRNLEYDPQRMFESKDDLIKRANWKVDESGVIRYGLKEGLMVTVGDQLWQLTSPSTFQTKFQTIGIDMSDMSAEDLGWKIVGSTSEFNIDGHVLKLYNNK